MLLIQRVVYPHADLGLKVMQAKRYIDEHYGSDIDLDRMAREACLSKFHFIRLFRRYYGKTPHAYLKEVRLAEARRLLGKGIPIRHVCFAVGFTSVPSFTRLFKAMTGKTPRTVQELAATRSTNAILDKKVSGATPIFIKKIS